MTLPSGLTTRRSRVRGCRRAADVLIVGQSRPGRVYPIAHATSCRLRKRQIQLERARVRKRIDRLTKAVSGVLVVIGCALTDIWVRGCDAFAKLRCQCGASQIARP